MNQTQGIQKDVVTLVVNGTAHELSVGDQESQVCPSHTLAQTLRETLQFTGTKVGCDQGACGSCTVIMDKRPILSCMTLTIECNGAEITTIEGLADIVASDLIKKSFPALALAAESVGFPELRNMGTMGGNLCQDTRCWYYRYPDKMGGHIPCYRKGKGPCHAIKGENRYHAILGGKKCYAVCPSDLAIALGALDARVKTVGKEEERLVPVLDFFNTLGTVLRPDEIITEVRVPMPKKNTVQVFFKNRLRKAIDFSVVSVAVMLDIDPINQICKDARIILGAVAPIPFRASATEAAIKGRPLNRTYADRASEAALENARPLSQNAYKVDIAKVLVKRALLSFKGIDRMPGI